MRKPNIHRAQEYILCIYYKQEDVLVCKQEDVLVCEQEVVLVCEQEDVLVYMLVENDLGSEGRSECRII